MGKGAGSPSNNVARAEAYLHAKFHHDPSNHLATIHQHYRQDRQRTDSIGRTVLQRVAQIPVIAVFAVFADRAAANE